MTFSATVTASPTLTPSISSTVTGTRTRTGTPTPTLSQTPASGQVYQAWADTNGVISSITGSASTIYIGGTFTLVSGHSTNRIAAIRMSDGGVETGWAVAVDNGNVLGLSIVGGNLYAVGSFTTVNGGTVRNGAAAFSLATGALQPWNPNLGGGTASGFSIEALGGALYVVGDFSTVNGGTPRNHAAAFDAVNGNALAWNPNLDQPASVIRTNGTDLYVGGLFGTVNGGTARNFAAAFNGAGTATAWNPNPSAQVLSVWHRPGSGTVMLGGQFGSVNGSARGFAAEVNAASGALTGWNPNFNAAVRDMREANGVLYAVGNFSSVNGGTYALTYLSAVNPSTGAAYAWAPFSDAPLTVIYQYNPILVGGGMTNIAGSSKVGVAAIVEASVVEVATPNATPTYTPNVTATPSPTATRTPSASPTRTPAPAVVTGVVAGNGGGSYIFNGTGTPGDQVWVSVNGGNVGGPVTVGPDGTWSLGPVTTTVNPGDSITAHSGSPTGPSAGAATAGAAQASAITLPPVAIAGGATVLTFNGTAGQVVTVINDSTGQVLGTVTVPGTGLAGVTLGTPVTTGTPLQFIVNGTAGPVATVGAAGQPPVVTQGAVLVEGSTLAGTGVPGATIQVVDDLGRVLGSAIVAGDGTWFVPVTGATAGVGVKVVQDGVAIRLNQPALKLGEERVFLSKNVFRPLQGGSLDIGFKAAADENVTVKIFNVAGEVVRLVAEIEVRSGVLYALKWSGQNDYGENVAAGVYIVSVYGPNTRIIKKVVVLK